jgi:hypothetical protein
MEILIGNQLSMLLNRAIFLYQFRSFLNKLICLLATNMEGSKFMELHRPTCAGGFPPDKLFMEQRVSPSEFKFSGAWSRERGHGDSAVIAQAFYGSWNWKETANSKVTKVPKCAGETCTSSDGVKFKVVGFRDCGGYSYQEHCHNSWSGNPETVVHHRKSYTLVVEVLAE